MKRAIAVYIVALLVLGGSGDVVFSQENKVNCEDYMSALDADMLIISQSIQATNFEEPAQGSLLYLLVMGIRVEYENMEDIPDCAANLHVLVIETLQAYNDLIGLSYLPVSLSVNGDSPVEDHITYTVDTMQSLTAAAVEVRKTYEK